MEAIAIREGVKTKGEGSHLELIEYTAEQGIIDEHTRQFLQQMREYRNKISYEGFMVNTNYLDLNKGRIQNIIKRIFELLG